MEVLQSSNGANQTLLPTAALSVPRWRDRPAIYAWVGGVGGLGYIRCRAGHLNMTSGEAKMQKPSAIELVVMYGTDCMIYMSDLSCSQ